MGLYCLRVAELGPVYNSFRVLFAAIRCRTLAVDFYCLLQTLQIIFDNKFSIFSTLQLLTFRWVVEVEADRPGVVDHAPDQGTGRGDRAHAMRSGVEDRPSVKSKKK